MQVVRSGNHHRVDFFLLVEHLAEVRPLTGFWIPLKYGSGILFIDIAQRHNILGLTRTYVVLAHAANAHAGYIKLFARRLCQDAARHYRKSHRRSSAAHELTTGDVLVLLFSHYHTFHN